MYQLCHLCTKHKKQDGSCWGTVGKPAAPLARTVRTCAVRRTGHGPVALAAEPGSGAPVRCAMLCGCIGKGPVCAAHMLRASCEPLSWMQVRPNVHSAFHTHISTELQRLEGHRGDASSSRKRRSDAKLVASLCQQMNDLCRADPSVQQKAAAEFQRYQEVRRALPSRAACRSLASLGSENTIACVVRCCALGAPLFLCAGAPVPLH